MKEFLIVLREHKDEYLSMGQKLNWDLIRKALNDNSQREGFDFLQMDLAALEKMAGSGRWGWEERAVARQKEQSESCNHDPSQRSEWPGPDNQTWEWRGEELDGSFEAPATPWWQQHWVTSQLFQLFIGNQSHSVETQIKLMHSNGWRA